MKRFLLLLLVVITITSCKKNPIIEGDEYRAISKGCLDDPIAQTTLIYFTGTSLKSYFNVNIADAEKAVASGALGSGGRLLYLLPSSYSNATLYELTRVGDEYVTEVIETYSFNTLQASSVTQVINDVKSHVAYNENDMAMNLIVSGHGTGWVLTDHPYLKSVDGESSNSMWEKEEGALMTRFMGVSSDGYMDIADLCEGLDGGDVEFGYILFDECLMSNIELLYRLKDYSQYIVASPCEVMAAGFPYEYVLPNLFTVDGYNFDMVAVCEAYNNYYTNIATYKYGCVAMCVASELDELVTIMRSMTFEDVDADELQTYENLTDNVFYDLGDFVNMAAAGDSNLAAFNEQFDYAFPVAARLHTSQYYTALSNSGPQDITYYSGVSTSDPSVKFREDWVLEPWTIDTGRYLSVE